MKTALVCGGGGGFIGSHLVKRLKREGFWVRAKHIPGPLGVRGRNSHNDLIAKTIGWKPSEPLVEGLRATYAWIKAQVMSNSAARKTA